MLPLFDFSFAPLVTCHADHARRVFGDCWRSAWLESGAQTFDDRISNGVSSALVVTGLCVLLVVHLRRCVAFGNQGIVRVILAVF